MAHLRDGEVAVSDKNDSRNGPSGKKARNRHSAYLEVGGSRDAYNVTINFETKNGHWCEKVTGERCHGNGNGKGQKYGPPQQRDKRDPQQWCKHVKAGLADTDALAEAMDRTAAAFKPIAKAIPSEADIADKREFSEPVSVPVPAKRIDAARERLAAIEAEAAALRVDLEIGEKVSALVSDYGHAAVLAAIEKAAA